MKHVICAVLALISFNTFSQADFRPGYYVTNNNDTIKGLVDFRGNTFNAQTCHFKATADGKVQEFAPGEINSYRIGGGRLFVSRTVTIDKFGSNKLIQIGEVGVDTTKVTPVTKEEVTLFLECLIKGEMTVYFVRTKNEVDYYFLQQKNGELTTLDNNEVVYKSPGNVKYVKPSNQFIAALGFYVKDVPEMREGTKKLHFERESIVKFGRQYHNKVCTSGEKCIIYEKTFLSNPWKIGVSVVARPATLQYRSYAANFDGDQKLYGLGVDFHKQLYNLSERMFFDARIFYGQGTLEGVYMSQNINKLRYAGDVTTFRGAAHFSYLYPKYKFKPMIIGGLTAERITFKNLTRNDIKQDMDGDYLTSIINFGLNAGIGIQYEDIVRLSALYDPSFKRQNIKTYKRDGIELSLTYFIKRK